MSDIPSARELLDTVADYTDDPAQPQAAEDRPPRLGTVDAAYTGGKAKVRFDGESTTGSRLYVALAPVSAGQRVVLLPVGHTYVILGSIDTTGGVGSGVPVGTSLPGYWTAPPSGFLLEDGTVQLRAAYPSLFGVIGTTFNTGGETSSQFRLPDSRGRVQAAKGGGSFTTLGALSGEEKHSQTVAEMPAHTHNFLYGGTQYSGFNPPSGSGGSVTFGLGVAGFSPVSIAPAGSGTAFNVIQPSIVVLRCIKY